MRAAVSRQWLYIMDASQIARTRVRMSAATIISGECDPHISKCQRAVVIISLWGAVRFAGSDRLTGLLRVRLVAQILMILGRVSVLTRMMLPSL
jgi:hypothetical protein